MIPGMMSLMDWLRLAAAPTVLPCLQRAAATDGALPRPRSREEL